MRDYWKVVPASVLVLGFSPGCAGSESVTLKFPAEAAVLTVAENGPPESASEVWRIDTVPSLAIAARDGDKCTQFRSIGSLDATSSGGVVLAEIEAGEIRVFDSAGKCRASLGRRGSGAGEFGSRFAAVASGNDTVIAFETTPSFRVSAFAVAGGFVDRTITSRETLASMGGPMDRGVTLSLLGGGRLLMKTSLSDIQDYPTGRIPIRDSSLYVILDRAFNQERVIGRWPRLQTLVYEYRTARGGTAAVVTTPLHGSPTYDATDPSGARTCVGDSFQPAVSCFDSGGGGLTVAWTAAAIRTSRDEVRAYLENSGKHGDGSPDFNADDYKAFVKRIEVPSHHPFFSGIMVDSDLNIWVRPVPGLSADVGEEGWLVFSREGKLRAKALLPTQLRTPVIFGDHVLGSMVDGFGVPYVVKLRLRKGA